MEPESPIIPTLRLMSFELPNGCSPELCAMAVIDQVMERFLKANKPPSLVEVAAAARVAHWVKQKYGVDE